MVNKYNLRITGIITSFLILFSYQTQAQNHFTVESASNDPSLTVRGKEKGFTLYMGESDYTSNKRIQLLPREYSSLITRNKNVIAVAINKDLKVLGILRTQLEKSLLQQSDFILWLGKNAILMTKIIYCIIFM